MKPLERIGTILFDLMFIPAALVVVGFLALFGCNPSRCRTCPHRKNHS